MLAAFCGLAQAGYAQISPPVGWSGTAAQWFYTRAANDVSWSGGIRGIAKGTLAVGGKQVMIGAAYRFAANAPLFAARFAFGWPALFLAAGGLAYKWYTDNNFKVVGDTWMKKGSQGNWTCIGGACNTGATPSAGLSYCQGHPLNYGSGCWLQTVDATHQSVRTGGGGYLGQYALTNSDIWTPATETEFETQMAPIPVPQGAPDGWPMAPSPMAPMAWPVEIPIINPSPASVPLPQPMRVPIGEPVPVPLPVPNPNNDPQTWKQPVIDVVPAPIQGDPWRIDLQPKDIISPSPIPITDPVTPPVTPPDGTKETPVTPDLCEKNPQILACQVFTPDTVNPSTIDNQNVNISITADSGWGPSSGTCPAPRVVSVQGRSLSFSFTMLCDFATGIKPLFVGLAWISAVLLMLGIGKKGV